MAELFRFAGSEMEALAVSTANGTARVKLAGSVFDVSELSRDGSKLSFVYAGRRYRFDVALGQGWLALDNGKGLYRVQRVLPGEHDNDPPPGELVSMMPGTVLKLLVEPGSDVSKGTPLLILEAMKMELQVCSPSAGRVNSFPVAEGQRVMPGRLLVDFTPAE